MNYKSFAFALLLTVALYVLISLTPARQYALLISILAFIFSSGPTWYRTYLHHEQVQISKRQEQREFERLEKEREAERQAQEEAARRPILTAVVGSPQATSLPFTEITNSGSSSREYDLRFYVVNSGDKVAGGFNFDITIPRRYEILSQSMPLFPPLNFHKITGTTDGTYQTHFKRHDATPANGRLYEIGGIRLRLRPQANISGDEEIAISWTIRSVRSQLYFEGLSNIRLRA